MKIKLSKLWISFIFYENIFPTCIKLHFDCYFILKQTVNKCLIMLNFMNFVVKLTLHMAS